MTPTSGDPVPRRDRPDRVVVVVGTATEVGKTWFSCELLRRIRDQGVAVAARKPVQSFAPVAPDAPGPPALTDAEQLADASGEPVANVCPAHRWFPLAMAPPMAAEALGHAAFHAEELLAELHWPRGIALGLIETVGGVRSPLTDDVDSAGLAHLIRPDVAVLVADAGLGTINSVRSSLVAMDPIPTLVFLNRYDMRDDLHVRNRRWLEERDGCTIATSVAASIAWLAAS
jgi:dethiobiotin synthetase